MNIKEFEKQEHPLWFEAIRHIACILIFVTGWVLFRSDNIHYAISYIANMFGILNTSAVAAAHSLDYYVDTV